MADIQFYSDDNEDNPEEAFGIDDEYGEPYNPDEDLTPLQKIEKYAFSENIYSRQMVTRSLMESLRIMGEREEDITPVIEIMPQLSCDLEPSVRAELVEQLSPIADFCRVHPHLITKPYMSLLRPIVIKCLSDSNTQVRKTCQASLLILADHKYFSIEEIEEHICHVILDLASPESFDDFRTEAAALMTKLAPILGSGPTETHFMHRYGDMCSDPLFHVRKVIATNFGEMCTVLGQHNTEVHMLPHFKTLCMDGVWGVRKACAECFMQVSNCCSPRVRDAELAELFLKLVKDDSRWVRMAAFQTLGGFISTFADPSITGLSISEEGLVKIGPAREVRSEQSDALDSENNEPSSSASDDDFTVTKSAAVTEELKNILKDQAERDSSDSPADDEQEEADTDDVDGNLGCDKNGIDGTSEVVSDGSSNDGVSQTESSAADMDIEEQASVSGNGDVTEDAVVDDQPSVDEIRAQYWKESNLSGSEEWTQTDSNPAENLPSEESTEKSSVDDDDPVCHSPEASQTETENVVWQTKPEEDLNSPDSFTSFLFWRDPLPVVDPDEDLSLNEVHSSVSLRSSDIQFLSEKLNEMHAIQPDDSSFMFNNFAALIPDKPVTEILTTDLDADMDDLDLLEDDSLLDLTKPVISGDLLARGAYSPIEDEMTAQEATRRRLQAIAQNVIPQELLEKYLSMTDPTQAQTVDAEIARHCAFSLPAVAYTLGPHNWHCLRDLFNTLASDMQWKVRRTLAFCLHDLAIMIGQENTFNDLVPVFYNLVRDLDEVRVGVLKHLYDFLKLLNQDLRKEFLPQLEEFLNTDNNRNWRFREDLALQLLALLELYNCDEVHQYFEPIALQLAQDSVAVVREAAFDLVAHIMAKYSSEDDRQLPVTFVNVIIGKFAHDSCWSKRKSYCQICLAVLKINALPEEQFCRDMLPSLLHFGQDPVPNIRLTLAKVLHQFILCSSYFASPGNPHYDDIQDTEKLLREDEDRDVRYFIGVPMAVSEVDDSSFSDDQIPV